MIKSKKVCEFCIPKFFAEEEECTVHFICNGVYCEKSKSLLEKEEYKEKIKNKYSKHKLNFKKNGKKS